MCPLTSQHREPASPAPTSSPDALNASGTICTPGLGPWGSLTACHRFSRGSQLTCPAAEDHCIAALHACLLLPASLTIAASFASQGSMLSMFDSQLQGQHGVASALPMLHLPAQLGTLPGLQV